MSKHNKKSDNSSIIFVGVIAVITIGVVLLMIGSGGGSTGQTQGVSTVNQNTTATTASGVSEQEGKQYIDVKAKNGFTPGVVTAKANTNTILRVSTQNTFDCSSSIVIPKLGVSKVLPTTGKTEIDLGSQKPGTEIQASCSMGMYRLTIKFS